jgi:hypothetical protein
MLTTVWYARLSGLKAGKSGAQLRSAGYLVRREGLQAPERELRRDAVDGDAAGLRAAAREVRVAVTEAAVIHRLDRREGRRHHERVGLRLDELDEAQLRHARLELEGHVPRDVAGERRVRRLREAAGQVDAEGAHVDHLAERGPDERVRREAVRHRVELGAGAAVGVVRDRAHPDGWRLGREVCLGVHEDEH